MKKEVMVRKPDKPLRNKNRALYLFSVAGFLGELQTESRSGVFIVFDNPIKLPFRILMESSLISDGRVLWGP